MRMTRYMALSVMAAAAAWGQVNVQPRQITAPITAPAAPPSQQVAPNNKPEAPAVKHAATKPEAKPTSKAAAKPETKPAATHTGASAPATASKPAAAATHPQSTAKTAAPAKGSAPTKTAAKPGPAPPAKAAQGKSPMKPKGPVVTAKPQAPVQKPAAPQTAAAAPGQSSPRPRSRRDPFVSPVVEARPESGPSCETGKKCLAVNQITLRGIVKSQEGMIAVVENRRRVTYFLRENDPVFNGYVVKITGDAVVFRENTLDSMGRVGTRDVTLKVNAPAV